LVFAAAAAQTINPSSRTVIRDPRALQQPEIAQVLMASREALANRTLHMAYVASGLGPDVVMESDGRPAWMRLTSGVGYLPHIDIVTVLHYTRTAARSCSGNPLEGELVIEYEQRTPPGAWSVKARTRSGIEVGGPIFDMLSGATAVTSGGFRSVDGGRRARTFTAPWTTPPGAVGGPVGASQSLLIDVESLLPLRWSITLPATRDDPALPEYGLSFTYDAAVDVRAPDGISAPDCVR
jgi:hypothetical protein